MNDWVNTPPCALDNASLRTAQHRQMRFADALNALGELDPVAIRLAAMPGTQPLCIDMVWIAVFVGDHGVADEGVSELPQSATGERVHDYSRGGTAISVLACVLNATAELINLGTVNDLGALPAITTRRLGARTENFMYAPAMSDEQCARALHAGRHSAERAKLRGARLYTGGGLGVANATSAAALLAALLSERVARLPFSGPINNAVERRIDIIERSLTRHAHVLSHPMQALRCLGGFEIAALTGAYLACAKMGLPVFVDDFVSLSAAMAAEYLCPGSGQWFAYASRLVEFVPSDTRARFNSNDTIDPGNRLATGCDVDVDVSLLRLAANSDPGFPSASGASWMDFLFRSGDSGRAILA